MFALPNALTVLRIQVGFWLDAIFFKDSQVAAAGGIQGLRPMRYEKRVARNRFVFLVVFLLLMLLGLIWAFLPHH